jgi:ribosomal protein S21
MLIIDVKDGETIDRALKNTKESMKNQALLSNYVCVSILLNRQF